MGKKRKIPKPAQKIGARRIPASAVTKSTLSQSTDTDYPSFRFTYADKNRWTLSDWTAADINDLIAGFRKIEQYNWAQIKSHGSKKQGESVGTGYKLISHHPVLPENLPEDAKLSEIRLDKEKRLFGFRIRSVYYIVWFDRDHSVCPE